MLTKVVKVAWYPSCEFDVSGINEGLVVFWRSTVVGDFSSCTFSCCLANSGCISCHFSHVSSMARGTLVSESVGP